MELRIDPAFENCIPHLTAEQFEQLEKSLQADSRNIEIMAWDGVIVEGHHRYKICQKHGLPFNVIEVTFPDVDAAKQWIRKRALAQRHLTPKQFKVVLGEIYNAEKKGVGGDRKSKGQLGTLISTRENTAEKVAAEHGVSPRTVKRSGKTAEAVAKAPEAIQPALRDGAVDFKPADIDALNELSKGQQAKVVKAVAAGEVKKLADAVKEVAGTVTGGASFDPEELDGITLDIEELAKPYKAAKRDLERGAAVVRGFLEDESLSHIHASRSRVAKYLEEVKSLCNFLSQATPKAKCPKCDGGCVKCAQLGWVTTGSAKNMGIA